MLIHHMRLGFISAAMLMSPVLVPARDDEAPAQSATVAEPEPHAGRACKGERARARRLRQMERQRQKAAAE